MIRTAATLAAFGLLATPALAQDFEAPLKARQGMFNILSINLGIIGDMAKGETDYDADAAQAAADSIVGVSMVNPAPLFPEGSDNAAIEGTRALPAIWEDLDDVVSKWNALGDAATNLQEVAATGQEALGPALGQVGNACKACHDEYRASDN
ncbi:c-type cytochrome [Roseivivax isoporae]|uniref:Cytochrome C554 n=1 Tax=Roseivivax isoporae LMG 25204 TaxID=1449351 RepID=X7FEY6_9RHOB|nr:cytochrome c [Roseivivax isoporae]ETX30631.1 cytochrome C554 [Roseivivax isoporae LMG 25204]